MALKREYRNQSYVSGRMIAIAEHYAGEKFGPHTLETMFTHPKSGVDVWIKYIDNNDEYYNELKDFQLPVTIENEVEKGKVWIGYYHQKSVYYGIK